MKIEELDLSVSTYHRLVYAGIHTVEKLLEFSDDDLFGIKNMNRRNITEIREKLDKIAADRHQMTNADCIRAMSDEEIAEYVCRNSINTLCDIICGGECNAIATLKRSGDWACKEIVMKWLQQPAEDDAHDS